MNLIQYQCEKCGRYIDAMPCTWCRLRPFIRPVLGVVLIGLLAWSLTGCAAGSRYIGTAAGYVEGRAQDKRAADDIYAKKRREASKRVHCRTSLSDYFDMPAAEREAYANYCGYE